jgi:hypothetical protein
LFNPSQYSLRKRSLNNKAGYSKEWRLNVGPEVVNTRQKAAEVSYTDRIAPTAGTKEQKKHLRSVNTIQNEQSVNVEQSIVVGSGG